MFPYSTYINLYKYTVVVFTAGGAATAERSTKLSGGVVLYPHYRARGIQKAASSEIYNII